ncbi:MAG: signal recognition particle-docking protein FtsY, partial [Actinobacteria bacterium]|nr:signal recognition particle-docking protein FtsY [Actinomycetota bacterium]
MSLFSKFTSLFTRGERAVVDWNELEQTLIGADLGPALAQRVSTRLHDARDLSLPDALAELLSPAERSLQIATDGPTVILVVGVNGSGKTT